MTACNRTLIWLGLATCLSACGSGRPYRLDLMPLPAVFDGDSIPFPSAPLEDDLLPYRGILYVTDREPAEEGDREYSYRNERGSLIRVGSGTIASSERPSRHGRPSARPGHPIDPERVVLEVSDLQELGYLADILPYGAMTNPDDRSGIEDAGDLFAERINRKLALSEQKDIFIYVHGYKVVFEDPLLVAAQLWHFLGNDGVFLAYAWPSTPRLFAYFRDLETARLSSRNLRKLLEYLAQRTAAERIHIIAYSAGGRVVIGALDQLGLLHRDATAKELDDELRIGKVALIASDYDKRRFAAAMADGMMRIPESLTIYMSRTDDALGLSRFFFGESRLGQMVDSEQVPETVSEFFESTESVSFVDVSEAEKSNSGNGHAYFRKSPWASSDLLMSLKYGLTPAERGLVRKPGHLEWSFPPDYIELLRAAVLAAAPKP